MQVLHVDFCACELRAVRLQLRRLLRQLVCHALKLGRLALQLGRVGAERRLGLCKVILQAPELYLDGRESGPNLP
eukprot:scaffold263501_cov25-Tisochrysis_lutea.AAC.1